MKMNKFLALFLLLSTTSIFAAETPAVAIPKSVLDIHTAACPEFSKPENADFFQRTVVKLPGNEYGPGPTLYLLGCEMYAYNSMERAYLADAYSVTLVAVSEVGSDKLVTGTANLMGSTFDPATNTLGTTQLGRGMGDCGSSALYAYDAFKRQFVLTEARVKDSCDGQYSEWPVVYKK
jgi:hypothetical protein